MALLMNGCAMDEHLFDSTWIGMENQGEKVYDHVGGLKWNTPAFV